ncbi:cytochrome P450 CYP570A1 [Xylariaceae sp. FL0804]|nr:cytochrome P450 CYP570A1 [Xylariaceae sp. FL0804]
MLLALLAVAAAIGLAYQLMGCVAEYQKLRHIPGPFWARVTHFWVIRHILRGNYIDMMLDMHTKYGPVVVMAPDYVLVSDPSEIRQMGSVRSSWHRGPGYKAFRFTPGKAGDMILSERDDKAHARMRAKLMPGYAGKTVEGVEQMVDTHVTQMVDIIESKYVTDLRKNGTGTGYRPLDFARLAQFLTIDVITSFAFQDSFRCLERDDDFHGYLAAVNAAVKPLLCFAFLPWYPNWLMDSPALARLFPEGGFFPQVFALAGRQVGLRYGGQSHELKERNDVLGSWVAAGISQRELVNETVAQLTAGGETTSTGIRAVLLHLLTSARSYRALQAEIDEAIRAGAVPSFPISDAAAAKLPYLEAALKEGLRLIAPAAFFPKVSDKDETLCGYTIPAGVSVEPAYKPALRTKEIFGDDAEFFRPERWLEADQSQAAAMDQTFRFVFGGPSRWECLGKGLAFMQMRKVIFELLRQFDLALVNPSQPWKAAGTRIWGIEDFLVQVTKRD